MSDSPVSNLKVLQVSSYGPPHAGGLEKIAARIFSEMKKQNVAIRWMLSDAPSQPAETDTIRIKVWNQLDQKYGLPIPFPRPSAYLQLYREVAQAQVVHIHDGYYFICLVAVIMAKLRAKKIVMTVHIWGVPYKNPVIQLCQALALNLCVVPCVMAADQRVTYNRRIFGKLAKMKTSPHFISTGIDPAFGTPSPTPRLELLLRHNLPTDRPVVIFAGRYSHKKGLPIVREIARRLPDVCFVLCGSGPESPGQWQLTNVVDMGWTKADKLRELFSCSDLFLLPSRGEGFPLAIQEAMSCGLPCAVFEETWSALDDARDLFVILEDFAGPAEAVEIFLRRPDRASLPARVINYARENWSLETMIDSYLQIYRDLVKAT